jgi:hypothetical protein
LVKSYKIDLDACCLNRPFDDQSQDRIRLESEAVIILLGWIRSGKLKLVGSEILEYEISRTPDVIRQQQVMALLKFCGSIIKVDENIKRRAEEVSLFGIRGLDAFHIACAEKGNVDGFLTTDDSLIKLWEKNKKSSNINISNPLKFLQEIVIK